ncbi:MAG: 50S ribosomal protein L25 [Acidobacteria bacterium]|nr:50S ribosomal protein L25 [Acidobacteriota bacterium]
MKDALVLEVELREPGSSNEAKRLRREGLIPAVLYGSDRDPRTISVSPRTVVEILRSDAGQNSILNLKVADGAEQTALIHDYQVDPVSHKLLHADFKRIAMDVEVEVEVPLEVIGEAPGVKVDKGILDQILRELSIRCLPGAIPDEFQVDVSELGINESVHVSDLEIPEGVELLTDPESTIVLVAPPAAEEEVETEDEDLIGEMAEPELIGREGTDEDADEGGE